MALDKSEKAAADRQRFKDAAGREWFCRVDWAAMRRSEAAGVDLSIVEQYLAEFYRGSHKLVDALWAVLCQTVTESNITREQFEGAITGEAMVRGREALLAGLEGFFPSGRAELMRRASAEVADQIRALLKPSPRPSTGSLEKSA